MTIQNLGKTQKFATKNLGSGFQILIKKNDREKTEFCINYENSHFENMPFGLKTAPRTFRNYVNNILQNSLVNSNIYIDDVLICDSRESIKLT